MVQSISVPEFFEYCGVFLTRRCTLACSYCITAQDNAGFTSSDVHEKPVSPDDWARALNRFRLPLGVPVTFLGGEPFLYHSLLEIVDLLKHEVDIQTALPSNITRETFKSMKCPEKLNRKGPQPIIRVSYHPGQMDLDHVIARIRYLQDLVSIGLYILDYPNQKLVEEAREKTAKAGIFFQTKPFLGIHKGKRFGCYVYPEGDSGKIVRDLVECQNPLLVVDTDGLVYKCHSDLYHRRVSLALGNIFNPAFKSVSPKHHTCCYFGLCSSCDLKAESNSRYNQGTNPINIRVETPWPQYRW